MNMFLYPATITRDEGSFIVRFRDFPEAITDGKTLAEALVEADDLLGSVIAHRIAEKEPVPHPSTAHRGQRLLPVPLWIAGKLAVYQTMREQGLTNVELARRLGVTEAVVRRLVDPDHETKDEKLTAALAAMGQRLVVGVEAA
ncbi:MAG: type II toxin-antitoxin system HicB family antitoxin [Acidobacteria bacterium]|nr:type II toxin-antitoxin system HicB family antitoxin [Acidobacteriota bacterium]